MLPIPRGESSQHTAGSQHAWRLPSLPWDSACAETLWQPVRSRATRTLPYVWGHYSRPERSNTPQYIMQLPKLTFFTISNHHTVGVFWIILHYIPIFSHIPWCHGLLTSTQNQFLQYLRCTPTCIFQLILVSTSTAQLIASQDIRSTQPRLQSTISTHHTQWSLKTRQWSSLKTKVKPQNTTTVKPVSLNRIQTEQTLCDMKVLQSWCTKFTQKHPNNDSIS